LVYARDQTRPQRRHRARAADDRRLSVHVNVVTRLRIGIACNVRHSTAEETSGIYGGRNVRARLIVGFGEDRTNPATGCSPLAISFQTLLEMLPPFGSGLIVYWEDPCVRTDCGRDWLPELTYVRRLAIFPLPRGLGCGCYAVSLANAKGSVKVN
jgi:hypothetical protein